MKTVNKLMSAAIALALVAVMMPSSEAAAQNTVATYAADLLTVNMSGATTLDLAADEEIIIAVREGTGGTALPLTVNADPANSQVGGAAAASVTNNADNSVTLVADGDQPANNNVFALQLDAPLADDTAYVITWSTASGDYGTAYLVRGTANQVTITANVLPALTFAVTGSTAINMGDMVLGAVSSSTDANTLNIATNGAGYSLYAQVDDTSAADVDTFAGVNTSMNVVSKGFGFNLQKASGDGTVEAAYDGNDETSVSSNTTADIIATHNATDTASYLVDYYAKADASVEPGAKAWTITYTVTADF